MDEYVCVCMCGKKTRTDADARCFVLLVAGKMRRGKGDGQINHAIGAGFSCSSPNGQRRQLGGLR
jgi:hypothetical protein